MGRFKTPAPAPPTTPYTRTPLRQPTMTPRGISNRQARGVGNALSQLSTLSLVASFDELCRNGSVLQEHSEKQFVSHIQAAAEWRKKCKLAEAEKTRLCTLLFQKDKELSGKDYQIRQARTFVEDEQRARKEAEVERDEVQAQLQTIKNLLLADGGKTINNETIERICTLERISSLRRDNRNGSNNGSIHGSPVRGRAVPNQYMHEGANAQLNPGMTVIEESAESLLDASDLTFDDTQGDILDGSRPLRNGKRRTSTHMAGKRRSILRKSTGEGTGLVTKTTVTIGQDGHAHAESLIETFDMGKDVQEKMKRTRKSRERRSTGLTANAQFQHDRNQEKSGMHVQQNHVPSAPPLNQGATSYYGLPPKHSTVSLTPTVKRTFSNAASVPTRQHCFQQKTVKVTEKCYSCKRRIKFGKAFLKCQDCEMVCHKECKLQAPLPCIAGGSRTPTNKTGNYLADHTPATPPMIPAILMCCVKDVEERGIDEVGIYRVPGNECDANEILDKFMKGSRAGGPPRLEKYEVAVVTSVIKKFLRSLKEPIIPLSLLQLFVDAAQNPDTTDPEAAMCQAVSELPRPNQDTLSYMMIHLQTVAANYKINKMDTDNLASIMGPTIVGYSSLEPTAIISEAPQQQAVMKVLLGLSADYWSTFLAVEEENIFGLKLLPPNHLTTPRYASGGMHTGNTPDNPIFNPPLVPTNHRVFATPLASVGPVARRTRSRQLYRNNSKKQTSLFQSPML